MAAGGSLLGHLGQDSPFLQPASIPLTLTSRPWGQLKSELDMLVGKCPEEPLEGDMSSPNSTGTQVRGESGTFYL